MEPRYIGKRVADMTPEELEAHRAYGREAQRKSRGGGCRPSDTPEYVVRDAQRRRVLAPRSITAELCGDPLPGYSALDRK